MKEGVWSQGPPIKGKVFATLPFTLGIPGTHTFRSNLSLSPRFFSSSLKVL